MGLFFNCFNAIISDSDNANKLIRAFKAIEISEEYTICGNWYIKLKEPSSSNILCIVLSLKKSVLTANSIEKLIKNRSILIIWEL